MGDNQTEPDTPEPEKEPENPPPPDGEPAAVVNEPPAGGENADGGDVPAPEPQVDGAPPAEGVAAGGGGEPLEEDGEPHQVEVNDQEPVPPPEPKAEKEADPFEVYKPKLYNFELYNYNKLKTMLFRNTRPNNLEIRCPEFAILLDHAIALLWLFYNDNTNWNNFTVPHIEWALKFISGIASENGQSFTDMDTVKRHLEQLLFQTYSETDTEVLNEKPPIEDVGIFGPINCPNRTKACTPIPETLKELLYRAPDMVMHLCLSTGSDSEAAALEELEISRANMMQSAYLKLNSFEKKHLTRITEEIELFEMIKALKHELGYTNGNVDATEITTLRLRVEELEKKLIDQAELR